MTKPVISVAGARKGLCVLRARGDNANHLHNQAVSMPHLLRAIVSRRRTLGAVAGRAGRAGPARRTGAGGRAPSRAPGTAAMAHPGDRTGGNRVVGTVDHARNGFDPSDILTDFDYGTLKPGAGRPAGARVDRDGGRPRDRDRAGGDVPGLDLQRPGARPGLPLRRGRAAAFRLPERRQPPAFDAFPRHPFLAHGRRGGGGGDRSPARNSSTSSTPSPSAATSTTATPCR